MTARNAGPYGYGICPRCHRHWRESNYPICRDCSQDMADAAKHADRFPELEQAEARR